MGQGATLSAGLILCYCRVMDRVHRAHIAVLAGLLVFIIGVAILKGDRVVQAFKDVWAIERGY